MTSVEWLSQHAGLLAAAQTSVRVSARARDEARWLVEHTELATERGQADVRCRVRERLSSTTR